MLYFITSIMKKHYVICLDKKCEFIFSVYDTFGLLPQAIRMRPFIVIIIWFYLGFSKYYSSLKTITQYFEKIMHYRLQSLYLCAGIGIDIMHTSLKR